MRIVVLGANGGVGRHAVRAAAERGHQVVAAARATDPGAADDGVDRRAVDVRDADAVHAALAGVDAVLWCVGVTRTSGPGVGSAALPHVVAAARSHGVTRLVSVSGAGVDLPGDRKGLGARFVSALTHRLAGALVGDKEAEHRVLAASDLVWTEVRPPRLSDGGPTGRWRLGDDAPGLIASPVTRGDVAEAMLDLAADAGQWVRASPFISTVRG